MQEDEVLKIAIAETSMIVRSGLALVLKRKNRLMNVYDFINLKF